MRLHYITMDAIFSLYLYSVVFDLIYLGILYIFTKSNITNFHISTLYHTGWYRLKRSIFLEDRQTHTIFFLHGISHGFTSTNIERLKAYHPVQFHLPIYVLSFLHRVKHRNCIVVLWENLENVSDIRNPFLNYGYGRFSVLLSMGLLVRKLTSSSAKSHIILNPYQHHNRLCSHKQLQKNQPLCNMIGHHDDGFTEKHKTSTTQYCYKISILVHVGSIIKLLKSIFNLNYNMHLVTYFAYKFTENLQCRMFSRSQYI